MGDTALDHVSGDVYLPVYVRQGSGDLATLPIHTWEESEAPAEYWLRIPLLTLTENFTFLPYRPLNTARSRIFLPAAILRAGLSWPPRKPHVFARLARWQLRPNTICRQIFLLKLDGLSPQFLNLIFLQ